MAEVGDDITDYNSDNDSAIGINTASICSLKPDCATFQTENGRTYHGYKEGKYLLPNDEQEKTRLDQEHELFRATFGGHLFTCPIPNQGFHGVLDVGTGTGSWAMQFAETYPAAKVIGIDLSPIQPSHVPSNLEFQIDDLEDLWTFQHNFSFIYCRGMTFAFSDWPNFFKQSFNNIEPGGYIEVVDIAFPVKAVDKTLFGTRLENWSSQLLLASEIAGKPLDNAKLHKTQLGEVGFEDIVENIYCWPTNPWPIDRNLKEIGQLSVHNIGSHVDGISMALLTRYLGFSKEAVEVLGSQVASDIKNGSIHAYWNIYVIYGRKPLAQQN